MMRWLSQRVLASGKHHLRDGKIRLKIRGFIKITTQWINLVELRS
jgi:hypothetical protein